jgi:glucokinase
VFHGSLGTAGEFGRMVVDDEGRCLEDFVSRKSIDRRIRAVTGGAQTLSAGEMAALYRGGEVIVCEVIDSAMALLGRHIANQVTVMSVGTVVIGGGLVEEMGDEVLGLIGGEVREYVFPKSAGARVRIVGTALKENAGLLGAAAVARGALEG